MVNFDKLYEKLADKQFQDTENTDFFYNYFVVQYTVSEEKEVERTLDQFKEALSRPTNYIDVLSLVTGNYQNSVGHSVLYTQFIY